jgi:hypothetical protein
MELGLYIWPSAPNPTYDFRTCGFAEMRGFLLERADFSFPLLPKINIGSMLAAATER